MRLSKHACIQTQTRTKSLRQTYTHTAHMGPDASQVQVCRDDLKDVFKLALASSKFMNGSPHIPFGNPFP